MVRIAQRLAETEVHSIPRMKAKVATARVVLALGVIQIQGADQEGLDIIQQLAMQAEEAVVLPLLPMA